MSIFAIIAIVVVVVLCVGVELLQIKEAWIAEKRAGGEEKKREMEREKIRARQWQVFAEICAEPELPGPPSGDLAEIEKSLAQREEALR